MTTRRILQTLILCSGIALLIWGILNPSFHHSDGFPKTSFCFFLSAAAALCLLAWMVSKKWENFGIWMSLAIIGQAATLQTIDAGRRLHFQHYRPFDVPFPSLLILS